MVAKGAAVTAASIAESALGRAPERQQAECAYCSDETVVLAAIGCAQTVQDLQRIVIGRGAHRSRAVPSELCAKAFGTMVSVPVATRQATQVDRSQLVILLSSSRIWLICANRAGADTVLKPDSNWFRAIALRVRGGGCAQRVHAATAQERRWGGVFRNFLRRVVSCGAEQRIVIESDRRGVSVNVMTVIESAAIQPA
jgi:hypothetical protein